MHIEDLDGILLDLDGVMTETAQIHAEAWKTMFDVYLRERAARNGGALEPFDANHDYRKFVDGKPRYDGVASFLQSRGIDLPLGEESDPPENLSRIFRLIEIGLLKTNRKRIDCIAVRPRRQSCDQT